MGVLLCPTDFSPVSENALRYAFQLAEKLSATVHVIHAFDPIAGAYVLGPQALYNALSEQKLEEASAHLSAYIQQVKAETGVSVEVSQEMVVGMAGDAILDSAERLSPDSIVMGTVGATNNMRKLWGTVSSAISSRATSPVLLIPPDAKFGGLHRVAYATDFSEKSMILPAIVSEFAHDLGAELCCVHIFRPGEVQQEGEAPPLAFERYAIHLVEHENPTEGLERFAKDENIGMLVVVQRHRSFLERLLHHSISFDLAKHPPVPLLVLHEG